MAYKGLICNGNFQFRSDMCREVRSQARVAVKKQRNRRAVSSLTEQERQKFKKFRFPMQAL